MTSPFRITSGLSVAATFLLLVGCGGGHTPTTTPQQPVQPPPPPGIQFSASSSSIQQGSSATLTWTSTNAKSVSIDNGIGTEPTSGSVSVTPTATTTYTAVALEGAQRASQSVTITVTAPPPPTPTLTSIALAPATVYLRVSGTKQFTATGTFSDGSTSDITSQVTWTSNSSTIASVADATVTAASPGATDIQASLDGMNGTAHVVVNASAVSNVLTYHGNVARDGAYTNETTLTTENVKKSAFGKRFSYAVDGQIYAQPLYVSNLQVGGASHNVVFVATENDSVYAFDADGQQKSPLWKVNLGTPQTGSDALGIKPLIGITSTPVIDAATNTMYVVAVNTSGSSHFQLHALDITTGDEKFGGPVAVTGSVSGSGGDNNGGVIKLESGCYQRSGLVLANNNIYIPFGHCNHGWLLAYDSTSLQQTAIFNSTPDGSGGTFWMSGGAGAVDKSGNIFWMTGTNFGDSQPGYNNSFLQMTPTLTVADYFTPSNNQTLITNDADLGSGALVLMPDNSSSTPHEVIGGGKDGRIFVIDRDHMGETQSPDQVVQVVQEGTSQYNNLHCTPAYWNGNLYVNSANDVVRAYSWSSSTGKLSSSVTSKGSTVFGSHGATPIVSANGNNEGIVWETEATAYSAGGPAILHAYDANDLGNELYNSSQSGSRDTAGAAIKFTPPIVADGLVFVPTNGELDIYGLL